MEITKDTFEAMIVLLYKIEEYEACDALLQVFKRIQAEGDAQAFMTVVKPDGETVH